MRFLTFIFFISASFTFHVFSQNVFEKEKQFNIEYGILPAGLFGGENSSFIIHQVGINKLITLNNSHLNIGPHFIGIRDRLNDEDQNHIGLKAQLTFVKRAKLRPFIGVGPYISVTSDLNENSNAYQIGLKAFAGFSYYLKKNFYLSGTLGNFRSNFDSRAVILHPTFGMGINL